MKKKLVMLFAVIVMSLMFAISANALDATGRCGDDVYWSYDSNTKELVISSTINGLPVTVINIDNNDASDEGFDAFNEICDFAYVLR